MKLLKTIKNKNNISINIYLCDKDGMCYLLGIPDNLKDNSELVVESFNSGGKRRKDYEDNIRDAISDDGNHIETLFRNVIDGFPVTIPVIPYLEQKPDFQQLSFDSVEEYKIHEKAYNCIQDAKEVIKELTGKEVQDKVFLYGYSASGVFAQRFSMIYPELVGRCLVGGAAGSIPIPTEAFDYPLGLNHYKELFGKNFNDDEYKKIMFGYFTGELEGLEPGEWGLDGKKLQSNDESPRAPMHDMSYNGDAVPYETRKKQRALLGDTMNQRLTNTINYLKNYLGMNIESIIVEGARHKGIFNPNMNPNASFLIDQLTTFYKAGKQLDSNGVGCCKELKDNIHNNTITK